MITGDLFKLSVSTLVEAEEAVAALLEHLFHQPAALYTDDETLVTQVSVFLKSERAFSAAIRRRLEAGLARLRAAGLTLGPTRIKLRRLPRRNWAEAWKRHFKPMDVRGRLLVKPTWSRRAPRAGQAVVLLDPGLSFGTGQHPTTAFCLERIVVCRRARQAASCLDIGTGSGILAIAAAKLGFAPVEAFDFDPEAVRVAKENAVLNDVRPLIKIDRRDLRRLPAEPARQFDLVCANLLGDLLVAEVERIGRRVAAGGTLVLAGILGVEFERVRAVYAAAGWRLVASRQVKEWKSGAFRRAG